MGRTQLQLMCCTHLYACMVSRYVLGVESEGRPESEVRRRVGVGLTEYTEEGNG